jgi:hypothetical protein
MSGVGPPAKMAVNYLNLGITPVISAFGMPRQENLKLEARQGYIVRSYLKNKIKERLAQVVEPLPR